MKRLSIRDSYSFVDFPEEEANVIIGKLNEAEYSNGVKFFAKAAITINAPREKGEGMDEDFGPSDSHEDHDVDGGEGEMNGDAENPM